MASQKYNSDQILWAVIQAAEQEGIRVLQDNFALHRAVGRISREIRFQDVLKPFYEEFGEKGRDLSPRLTAAFLRYDSRGSVTIEEARMHSVSPLINYCSLLKEAAGVICEELKWTELDESLRCR